MSSLNHLLETLEAALAKQRALALAGDAEALHAQSQDLAKRLNELLAADSRSSVRPDLHDRLMALQQTAYATGTLVGRRHAAVESAIRALQVGSTEAVAGSNGMYARAGFMQFGADVRSLGQA